MSSDDAGRPRVDRRRLAARVLVGMAAVALGTRRERHLLARQALVALAELREADALPRQMQGACDGSRRLSASSGLFPQSRSLGCEYATRTLDGKCAAAQPPCPGCCAMERCFCNCLMQDFFCWCFRVGSAYAGACGP